MARSGTDYQSRVGTATFPAGLTTTIITVPVTADFTGEPNEPMHLNIDVPFNATIARGQAQGHVADRAVLGGVDVCAREHRVAPLGHPRLVGQFDE